MHRSCDWVLDKDLRYLIKYLGKFGSQVGVGCKVCFIAVFEHSSLEKKPNTSTAMDWHVISIRGILQAAQSDVEIKKVSLTCFSIGMRRERNSDL